MKIRQILSLMLVGALVPILSHAGDFSSASTAAFAQNIIDPDTAFPNGGSALPELPAAGHDFGRSALHHEGIDAGASVSAVADNGQLPDSRPVAAMPDRAGDTSAQPVQPMATSKPSSYRWQSLVPGVLK